MSKDPYRATSKPPQKAKDQSWPFDTQGARPHRAPRPPDAVDRVITEYYAHNRRATTAASIMAYGAFLLFLLGCGAAVMYWSQRADLARENCIRSGGRIVEVHGTRDSWLMEAWVCIGGDE